MFSARLTSGVFLTCFKLLVLFGPTVFASDLLRGFTLASVDDIKEDVAFALSGGHDQGHRSLSAIESVLSVGFESLPKNQGGLLERPALNYLVHRYFSREYGWLLRGLRSNSSDNQTEVNTTTGIHMERLPAFIEQVLEKRHAGGFSLQDAAVMVLTLDHLILNEHFALLQAAYKLRGFNDAHHHNMRRIHAVVDSWRLLYTVGGSLTNRRQHFRLLRALKDFPQLIEGLMFFNDAVESHFFAQMHRSCPFTEPTFSFSDTWSALSEAMRMHGTYEDIECREMNRALSEMDPAMSGRVPLGRFYKPDPDLSQNFVESVEYLRQLGALDESAAGSSEPQLIISNYVLSANNCVQDNNPYYRVCCKSECETLMDQLQGSIAAPSATAETILNLVQALPSSTILTSRNLSEPLVSALWQVSDLHGGDVPLHGRLFAQWMHYAYPHECPYPHTSNASVGSLSAEEFQAKTSIKSQVTEQEMAHHAQNTTAESHILPHMSQWTLEEELYVSPPEVVPGNIRATRGALAGIIACVFVALWKASVRMLRATRLRLGDKQALIIV